MKTRHFLSSIWSPSRMRSGSLSHSWAWLSAGMLNQIPPAPLASYLLSQCGTSRSALGTLSGAASHSGMLAADSKFSTWPCQDRESAGSAVEDPETKVDNGPALAPGRIPRRADSSELGRWVRSDRHPGAVRPVDHELQLAQVRPAVRDFI